MVKISLKTARVVSRTPGVRNVYKPFGKTPLQIVRAYQNKHGLEGPVSYAGRLDPMAEGVLLLLVGEENKRRSYYEKLDKSYVITILFGYATDSYDILGMVINSSTTLIFDEELLSRELQSIKGNISLTYPPYSSKTVNGKPLYWYARKNLLHRVGPLPKKNVVIYSIKLLSHSNLLSGKLLTSIKKKVNMVEGNFRQDEILARWSNFLTTKEEQYKTVKIAVTCSSGTYMRSLAYLLGKRMGISTLCYSITRICVGPYTISDSEILSSL